MNIMSKKLICISIAFAAHFSMRAASIEVDASYLIDAVEETAPFVEEVLPVADEMIEFEALPVADEISDEWALIQELMLQNGALANELERTQEKLEEARELLRKVRFDIKNHNEEERELLKRDLILCGSLSGLIGTVFGAGVMYWLKK
jgi:hypothetical protein